MQTINVDSSSRRATTDPYLLNCVHCFGKNLFFSSLLFSKTHFFSISRKIISLLLYSCCDDERVFNKCRKLSLRKTTQIWSPRHTCHTSHSNRSRARTRKIQIWHPTLSTKMRSKTIRFSTRTNRSRTERRCLFG